MARVKCIVGENTTQTHTGWCWKRNRTPQNTHFVGESKPGKWHYKSICSCVVHGISFSERQSIGLDNASIVCGIDVMANIRFMWKSHTHSHTSVKTQLTSDSLVLKVSNAFFHPLSAIPFTILQNHIPNIVCPPFNPMPLKYATFQETSFFFTGNSIF